MTKRSGSVSKAEMRAARLADEMGLKIVDVELAKEAAGRFLRFFIEKDDGVDLNDCEKFHRAILPLVEDIDYDYLEVSSPGVDRPLKKEADFVRNMGKEIEIRLYKPLDGKKSFRGMLTDFADGRMTVTLSDGATAVFGLKETALVKPVFEVDESVFEEG